MAQEELARLDARARQVHREHPRCANCGRAKYKSLVKGAAVKRTDAYAFCRNERCALFERDQTTLVRVADLLIDLGTTEGRDALVMLSNAWIARRHPGTATGAIADETDPKGSLGVGSAPAGYD
jgi:hypothetical protein